MIKQHKILKYFLLF